MKKCYKEVCFFEAGLFFDVDPRRVSPFISLSFVEPEHPGAVQLSQSATAARPLLHRPFALCPAEGAVPGDPHALNYLQVDTHLYILEED